MEGSRGFPIKVMFLIDLPLEIECYGFTSIFKIHSSTLTFGENSTSLSPNDQ
jgi:hypothetical protein